MQIVLIGLDKVSRNCYVEIYQSTKYINVCYALKLTDIFKCNLNKMAVKKVWNSILLYCLAKPILTFEKDQT